LCRLLGLLLCGKLLTHLAVMAPVSTLLVAAASLRMAVELPRLATSKMLV
jgi:hypothetical protein